MSALLRTVVGFGEEQGMPNIKSAKKRLLTAAKAREGNKSAKSRIATTRRKFMEIAAGGDKAAAQKAFNTFCSALDKGVKRGVIKKGNADRRKGRAALRMNAAFPPVA
jgi:small subunit ribosomal protein S20